MLIRVNIIKSYTLCISASCDILKLVIFLSELCVDFVKYILCFDSKKIVKYINKIIFFSNNIFFLFFFFTISFKCLQNSVCFILQFLDNSFYINSKLLLNSCLSFNVSFFMRGGWMYGLYNNNNLYTYVCLHWNEQLKDLAKYSVLLL